jgi:uncharacterized protein (UPF0335 family)
MYDSFIKELHRLSRESNKLADDITTYAHKIIDSGINKKNVKKANEIRQLALLSVKIRAISIQYRKINKELEEMTM